MGTSVMTVIKDSALTERRWEFVESLMTEDDTVSNSIYSWSN
jgi:hypothetical protein